MKKSDNNEPFSFTIDEYIGSVKESDTHDWTKAVMRIKWGENPPSLDIRNVNMAQNRIGKGISLSNEEADKLVNILLDNGYGTLTDIENALKKKKSFFTITDEIESILDDDDEYLIEIK